MVVGKMLVNGQKFGWFGLVIEATCFFEGSIVFFFIF